LPGAGMRLFAPYKNEEFNGTARALGNDKKSLRKNQSCSKTGRDRASGVVKSAVIAYDATLRFAKVNRNGRISTVDLHSVSDVGIEASGQIGFSAMENMKVTIDYRDRL
jgi:hypothetical protein